MSVFVILIHLKQCLNKENRTLPRDKNYDCSMLYGVLMYSYGTYNRILKKTQFASLFPWTVQEEKVSIEYL